jgi:hypothetical protein
MNFPKRLLLYVILLLTLNIFCFSFVSLLGWIFDLSNNLSGVEAKNIAPFLSGIIVALPIWIFTWRFAQKTSTGSTFESNAKIRHLYFNIVLAIAVINLALFSYRFILGAHSLFSEFRFGYLASLIVWVPIFLVHIKPAQIQWFSETKENTDGSKKQIITNATGGERGRIHEFFLNITFLVSLVLIFISSRQIILEVLNYFLRLAAPGDVLLGSNSFDYNSGDISRLITGVGLWLYSWHFRIKNKDLDFRTFDVSIISVSQVFIFCVSIFVILAQFIELLFGLNNSQASFTGVFDFLPEVFSFSIISLLIWSYYSSSFLSMKFNVRFFYITSPIVKWIYRYSVRAISVLFLISSFVSVLVFLLGLPVGIFSPDLIESDSKWEFDVLSASISAAFIGFIVLRYINYKILKDSSEENQKMQVEKSYIYFVAILFLVVLIGALIAMLTIFINDLLGSGVGWSTLGIIRWPLAFSVSSLVILAIYRDNISNQLKFYSSSSSKEFKIEVLSGASFEKLKDEIGDQFKVRKWKSVQPVGKFKINEKQIESIQAELKKHGADKQFIFVEGKNKEVAVYYYTN